MKSDSTSVEESDLRAIVRLLGEVVALAGGLMDKKCYLLDGLCDLVGASEWRWALFAKARDDTESRCLYALRRKLHEVFETSPQQPGELQPDHLPPSADSSSVILSRRSLEARVESRIALCLDDGKTHYSARESSLGYLVLDEVPWLHWREWAPRSPAPRLSPRQQLTLNLLLLGFGRKEIASQIGISPGTVTGYVRELYQRFGVSSQTELMRIHHQFVKQ